MNGRALWLWWVPAIVALAPVLSHCGLYGGNSFGLLGRAACPELSGNVDALRAQYSANARANAKVRAFVQASKDLAAVSLQIESEAAEACQRMAYDLGAAPATLAASNDPGGRARHSCGILAAKIDAILREGVAVRAQATPPKCEANVSAAANCQGVCTVDVDPGEIVARCDPGKLSGVCRGQCSGRCDGRCDGTCNGACTARLPNGQCAGACSGQCTGTCDATCHTQCNGQWQAPRCEGYVRPPSADAECAASCRAHADVHASCTPAVVNVQVSQNAQLAARLAATLQANLPLLLHAEVALGRRLVADADVLVRVGAALPKIVGDAGAHALACIAASGDASARASISIKVSVQASASVTGRVGASG